MAPAHHLRLSPKEPSPERAFSPALAWLRPHIAHNRRAPAPPRAFGALLMSLPLCPPRSRAAARLRRAPHVAPALSAALPRRRAPSSRSSCRSRSVRRAPARPRAFGALLASLPLCPPRASRHRRTVRVSPTELDLAQQFANGVACDRHRLTGDDSCVRSHIEAHQNIPFCLRNWRAVLESASFALAA
ncbi:MAG: hypothetical protein B6A08_15935 [Sorangiineae bacterium NIC37A_2]|nr:MAG: hypothetical protein B6A08_15935 [Sorangiineae bacterium NIC37A_2]